MQNSQNKKKLQLFLLVLVAILTLGIGYASITAINSIININGSVSANQENFKVYFTESTITEGKGTVSIDEDDATIGYFDITGISKVGDYAEATYTILNDSNSVGAEISLQLTNSDNEYFKVTESVEDNQLQAGESTTATIKVEMVKTPIEDAVTTSITAKLIASPIENASATGGSSISEIAAASPVSFATDSWATIQKSVKNNNTSYYHVGDEKEVLIDTDNDGVDESYTVRIANMSTNSNCSNESYSETACGFVVEFVDIIKEMKMNDPRSNTGGYRESMVYAYLRDTLEEQLPEDLQKVIKPTRVISGYGCKLWTYSRQEDHCYSGDNDGNNFVDLDQKLYLLSPTEIFGPDDEYNNETAANTSFQLDYYLGMEPDDYNSYGTPYYYRVLKTYNGEITDWWLRSAYNYWHFHSINYIGYLVDYYDSDTEGIGVAPAFRIG